MNKIKIAILSLLSVLSLFVASISQMITVSPSADGGLYSWFMCMGDTSKTVYKIQSTEYFQYLTRSKSSIGVSEQPNENMFNNILSVAGYDFGKQSTGKLNVFEKFGLAGLSYSSYLGEWKYYDIDPCVEDPTAKNSNLGEYYTDRKDPQATYAERGSSRDPRTKQFGDVFQSLGLSIRDTLANWCLFISKFIFTIMLTLVGLSFSDVTSIVGLGLENQQNIFMTLHRGFFQPLVTVMILLSGCYIMYYGLIKKEYRTALVNGAGKTIAAFFLAIALATNVSLIAIPNQVSTFLQTVVISALGEGISGANDSLCSTDTGFQIDSTENFLEQSGQRMKSVLGCRMYTEFLLKPYIRGQWDVDNIDDLNAENLKNINSSWVGSPDVSLGSETIKNWGIFQVSVQSGYHTAIDGVNSANIGGLHKDWYRIVDALSNYDEKAVVYGSNSSGGSPSATGNGGGGDWLTKGTRANELAQQVYDYLTDEFGLSGAAAIGVLSNIEAESGWNINAIEASPTTSGGAGFGLYQFTDWKPGEGNKTQYISWLERNGRQNDWKAQTDFLFEDEIWNRAVEPFLRTNGVNYGVSTAFSNVEAWLSSTDTNETTTGFMIGYERPNYNESVNHLRSRRLPNAAKASEVFDANKLAQPDKWKLNGSSTGGNSAVRVTSLGTTGAITLYEQVDSTPLPQWNAWIGNSNERIPNAILSLILVIVGSIAPLIFGLLSSVFSIGLTLLMMVAPVFLLLGLWGGKGSAILTSFLGSVYSTVIKKVGTSILLVISVILTSNTMSLVNSLGYFRAIMLILVLTYVIIKNKDKFLDVISSVNIGQLNLSAFTDSYHKVKSVAKGTIKNGSKLAVSSVAGGIGSKKNGGNFREGMKVGAGQFITNKMYTSQTGRTAMAVYNSNSSNNTSDTINCINCGNVIEQGTEVHYDDIGNPWCSDCAYTTGNIDDFLTTIVHSTNTEDMNTSDVLNKNETIHDRNSEIVKEVNYRDWRNATSTVKSDGKDMTEARSLAANSVTMLHNNINIINQENKAIEKDKQKRGRYRTTKKTEYTDRNGKKVKGTKFDGMKTFNNMSIPDPIREHINAGELHKLIQDGTPEALEQYAMAIEKAWEETFKETMENRGFEKHQIEDELNKLKNDFTKAREVSLKDNPVEK